MVSGPVVPAASLALLLLSCTLTDLDDLQGTGGAASVGAGGGSAGAGGAGMGGTLGSAGAATCVADEKSTAVSLNGHCYRRIGEPLGWSAALGMCPALYGDTAHLATITETSELSLVSQLYPDGCTPSGNVPDPCDDRAFVGAHLPAEGMLGVTPFEWITGERWTWPVGGELPWANVDEPNSSALALATDGKFDGRPPSTGHPYLCEIP